MEFAAPSVEVAYRANLWLRSAIRVLVKLAEGELDPNNSGAEEVRRVAPPNLLGRRQGIAAHHSYLL